MADNIDMTLLKNIIFIASIMGSLAACTGGSGFGTLADGVTSIGSTAPAALSVTLPTSLSEGVSSNIIVANPTGAAASLPYTITTTRAYDTGSSSSGTLVFAAGETSKTIPLLAADDSDFHEDSVAVSFTPPTGFTFTKNHNNTIPVVDNDGSSSDSTVAAVNTNLSNYVSDIDGAPVITTTNTITVGGSVATALNTALCAASPGTKIIVPDGTYNNASVNFYCSGTTLCPEGTSNHPIVVQAATPGGAIFTGTSNFRVCGKYIVVRGFQFNSATTTTGNAFKVGDSFSGNFRWCDHCAFRQLNIDNYAQASGKNYFSMLGDVSGASSTRTSSYIEITDSKLTGKTSDGPVIYFSVSSGADTGHHRIARNYFTRVSGAGANGYETIRLGDSYSSSFSGNTIIEHNLFYQAQGELETVSVKTDDNIIRYNTFLETTGSISNRIGQRTVIEGNYFIGNNLDATTGIRITGSNIAVIGNHLQTLKSAAPNQSHRYPLGMMNGDGATCAVAAYCQVQSAIFLGNVVDASTSSSTNGYGNLIFGAAPDGTRTVAPANINILYNYFVNMVSTFVAFADMNASTLATTTFKGNITDGPKGLTLLDSQLAVTTGYTYVTSGALSLKKPAQKKDLYYLRAYESKLNDASMSTAQKALILMKNKNIYEMSAPLTNTDVGLSTAAYPY